MKKFYKTPISGLVKTLQIKVKDEILDDIISGRQDEQILNKLPKTEQRFILEGLYELEE